MRGVRIVAGVFGLIGWITLIVGGLGILALASTLGAAIGGRGGGVAALGTVAGSMVPLLLIALGPFTVWALLTALIRLHEQGQRIEQSVEALRSGMPVTPSAAVVAPLPRPVVPTPQPVAAPAPAPPPAPAPAPVPVPAPGPWQPPPGQAGLKTCPRCHGVIAVRAETCPLCGAAQG